jgi:cysteine sulfinate desulfinase/cysteine desulfurase-like protein
MGLSEDEALGSLRISLGIMNKESDTKKILNRLNNSIKY